MTPPSGVLGQDGIDGDGPDLNSTDHNRDSLPTEEVSTR
jgi:hypothetical protein